MHERRSQPRYGVRIDGKLMSPDMSFCADVVVRDLSEDGALVNALALAPATPVPHRLYLWQARTRTLFECTVQWRKHDRLIGLKFTQDCNRVSVRDLLDRVVPGQRALAGPQAIRPALRWAC